MDKYMQDIESAICDINLEEYDPKLSGVFTTTRPLSDAVNEPTTTANDIMKWEWQIAQYLKNYYLTTKACPKLNEATNICINSRGDVVASTIATYEYYGGMIPDILFTDAIMRIHRTVFGSFKHNGTANWRTSNIALLSIIGNYFYSSSAIRVSKINTSEACEFIDQLCEMVESGMLNTLHKLFTSSDKQNSISKVFSAGRKLAN